MNFDYTADELAFRNEVREYLKNNLPRDLADKVLNAKRLHRED